MTLAEKLEKIPELLNERAERYRVPGASLAVLADGETFECATLLHGQLPNEIRARHGFEPRPEDEIRDAEKDLPEAEQTTVLVHPECCKEVVDKADLAITGTSTTDSLGRAINSLNYFEADTIVVIQAQFLDPGNGEIKAVSNEIIINIVP